MNLDDDTLNCDAAVVRKRRKIVLMTVGGLIAVVAFWFFCLHEKEPSYNGRKLSEWLDDFDSPPKAERAAIAVRAFGTNALPNLVKWNSACSPFLSPLDDAFWKRPVVLRSPLTRIHKFFDAKDAKNNHRALIGFGILGTNAAPALAPLERDFETTRNSEQATRTALAIRSISTEGIVYLFHAAHRCGFPKDQAARVEIWQIERSTISKPLLITTLLNLSADDDPMVVADAISALGRIHSESDRVIPALTNALSSTNEETRVRAIAAIQEFGREAASSVPALQCALRDQSGYVRRYATNALKFIAPGNLR